MGMIEGAATPKNHPLLTAYEFSQWRKNMLEAYRGECPRHDPVQFIDEAYIDAFVEDCIAMLEETYQAWRSEIRN